MLHVLLHGARGFSCAVSGFGQVLKKVTLNLTRFFSRLRSSCLRPSAEDGSTKLLVAREKKTSGTQCNFFFIPYKTWRTVFIREKKLARLEG